jgi:small subunit ribosomal protein S8
MSKTSTDPIADMLTRIRNSLMVRKNVVSLPHSKVKEAVAKILKENNYIDSVRVTDARVGKTLELNLFKDGESSPITELRRTSTPGRRFYVTSSDIPTIKQGRGMVVISTSKGIMTGGQAKANKIGGELVCEVY